MTAIDHAPTARATLARWLHRLATRLEARPDPCKGAQRREPDCARNVPRDLRTDLGLPGQGIHVPGEALRKTLW